MKDYLGMTQWETITCQNPDPHEHRTIEIDVDLSERHGYKNFAPIPERLWLPPFRMEVWDWEAAAVASKPVEGQWCPMRCAVSQTIAEHGIWEPPETLTLLNLFEAGRLAPERWTFIDIGAQIGWFSMLAVMSGLATIGWEADPEVAAIWKRNMLRAGDDEPMVIQQRIGRDTAAPRLQFPMVMKIDIEGAEPDAVRMFQDAFENGWVKAALIETTPRFGVDVHLMADLMINGYGFNAFLLPHILDDQYTEYDQIADLESHCTPERIAEAAVTGNQVNVLYMQPDVPTVV